MGNKVECAEPGCDEPEENKAEPWYCSKHRSGKINKENLFPKEIHEKLHERVSRESSQIDIDEKTPGLFMLREIAQNADDCSSNILVFEFREDALYVYNDGRSFTQPFDEESEVENEFEKVVNIMTQSKKHRPEMTGTYGTGFQTVYYITNTPEIHSYGNHLRFDPLDYENDYNVPLQEERDNFQSPYEKGKDTYENQGTVFRFPWRKPGDTHLGLEEDESFETYPLPEWSDDEIKNMYETFVEYSEFLILCFQNLKVVRFLNRLEDNDEECFDFQVQRGKHGDYWNLVDIENDGLIKKLISSKGSGGYQVEDWDSKDHKKKESRFFIKSDFIKEGDKFAFLEKPLHDYKITYKDWSETDPGILSEKYKDIKIHGDLVERSDLHVLFPIDNFSSIYPPSYSTMPLAKSTKNNFIFSAPLYTKENRAEIETHSWKGEALKIWLKLVLDNLTELYITGFSDYIDKLDELFEEGNIDSNHLQDMVLNNLPASEIKDWVGAEGVSDALSDDYDEELREKLFENVYKERIYFGEDGLYPLIDDDEPLYYYTTDERLRYLLDAIGESIVKKGFFEHERFDTKELKTFVRGDDKCLIELLEIDLKEFFKLYEDSIDSEPIYDKGIFSQDFIENLIDVWCEVETSDKNNIPVFPNQKNNILPFDNLYKMPKKEYSRLDWILPEEIKIKKDFKNNIEGEIQELKKDSEGVKKIIKGVDEHYSDLIELEHKKRIFWMDYVYDWIDECIETANLNIKKTIDEIEGDLRFLLNEEGDLLSCSDDIYWLPYEHIEDLFEDSFDLKNWNLKVIEHSLLEDYQEQFEKYLDMFPYPRIVEDFQEEISGVNPKDRDLQYMMIDGIIKGLSNGNWEKNDLEGLKFLPVNGELKSIKNTCLGDIDDSDTREFLGVIDNEIQNRFDDEIKDNLINKLDVNDLNNISDKHVWVAEKISEFAEKNNHAPSKTPLSEREHEMISKSILEIDWESDIKNLNEILDKKILPVILDDEIYIDSPPPKNLRDKDTSKLREAYKREYPFLLNKTVEEKAPQEIINSIKHICINGIDDIGAHPISEVYPLLPLIEESGQAPARTYLMHFVVPGDNRDGESLFIEDELKEFLINEDVSSDTLDKIRKSFLPHVFKRYDGGQTQTTDYNAKIAPCIPKDILSNPRITEKDWIKPDEILTENTKDNLLDYMIVDEEKLLEEYPILEELSDTVSKCLVHMGAHENPEVSRFKSSIEEILDNRPDDFEKRLVDLFMYLIENDLYYVEEPVSNKIKDRLRAVDKEYWSDITEKKLSWVPTNDGLKEIYDVIAPLEDIEKVVGQYDPDKLMKTDLIEEKKKEILKNNKEKLKEHGVRTELDSDELCDCYDHHAIKRDEPQDELLKKIESKILENEITEDSFDKSLFFFKELDSWKKPSEVIIIQDSNIPDVLKDDYHIISEIPEYKNLFDLMKGKEGVQDLNLSIENILDSLSKCDDFEEGLELWSYMIGKKEFLTSGNDLGSSFSSNKIFPYKKKFFSLGKVIFPSEDDKRDLHYKGILGEYISIETGDESIEILDKLGCKRLHELDTEMAKDIFYSCIEKYNNLSKNSQGFSELESDIQFLISTFIKSHKSECVDTIFLDDDKKTIPVRETGKKNRERFSYISNVILISGVPDDIIKDMDDEHEFFKRVDTVDYDFILSSDAFEEATMDITDEEKKSMIRGWLSKNGVIHIYDDGFLEIAGEPSIEDPDSVYRSKSISNIIKNYLIKIDNLGKNNLKPKDYSELKSEIEDLKDYIPYKINKLNIEYELEMKDIDGGSDINGKVGRETFINKEGGNYIIWFSSEDAEEAISLIKERLFQKMMKSLSKGYPKKMLRAIDKYLAKESDENKFEPRMDIKESLESLQSWWEDYLEDEEQILKQSCTFVADDVWSHIDIWGDDINSVEEREKKIKETLMNHSEKEARELFFRILGWTTFWSTSDHNKGLDNFLRYELDELGLGYIYDEKNEIVLEKILDGWIDGDKDLDNLYPRLRRRFIDLLAIKKVLKDDFKGSNFLKTIMSDLVNLDSRNLFFYLREGSAPDLQGTDKIIRGFVGSFTENIFLIVREFDRLGINSRWEDRSFHISYHTRLLLNQMGMDIDKNKDEWRIYNAKSIREKLKDFDPLYKYHDIPFEMYVKEVCDDCEHNLKEGCNPELVENCHLDGVR